jgi:chemotaxis signal transduction protein
MRQQTVDKYLIVRLCGVGALVRLAEVIEVCKQVTDRIDWQQTDLMAGIVGSLKFRNARIPVVDPTLRLGMESRFARDDQVVLVLSGTEGNCALLVDEVDGIAPASNFAECEIPLLLKFSLSGYYSKVILNRGEPMIVLEQDRFFGVSVDVA